MEAVESDLSDGSALWSFKLVSLQAGIEKLEAASFELQKASSAKVSGIPYDEDTEMGSPPTALTAKSKAPAKKKRATKKKRR